MRFALLALAILISIPAEARRHHKFKGVIIVNQIMKLDGTLTVNGVQAMEYSGIKTGDILETGDRSFAVIRIPGLAIFRLGANTRFRISSFSDRNESRFELQKGILLSLFRRPGHHVIQLSHSTLTVHGTTFFAQTDPAITKDFVCLCEGKIQATTKGAPTAKVRQPGSAGPEFVAAPAPSPSPYSGPVISAEPTSSPDLKSKDLVTIVPSPTPVPLSKDLEVVSQNEHKQFEISDEGIDLKGLKLLDLHSVKEIQDLDSLYALP